MNIIFDMETADPDDFLTLCFLGSHPKAQLRAVTVTPGGKRQVGLVRKVLSQMGMNLPVGARDPLHPKNAVSSYYEKVMGSIPEEIADGLGHDVLADTLKKYPDATILTGAPVSNLGRLFDNHDVKLTRWVAQGGFAGDNIVPPEKRLEKFDGKLVCPTFNFNGDPKAALALLESNKIEKRICISKNVCHGVYYTSELHKKYETVKDLTPGTKLIYKAMDIYLSKKKEGKKLHDPLAACTALDESVCELVEVMPYRVKGQWGSKLIKNTRTWISIDYDRDLFERIFLCQESVNKTE
jgi:inosine-uridine nucleoside N-ribohydrolase